MNVLLVFVTIILFLCQLIQCSIVYLQSVCRHGDRAPINWYPKYEHAEQWPMGKGRLTEVGVKQCYNNGLMYRDHFKTLFGKKYDSEKVYIQSSYIDRTITSAQSFAAGFFLNSDYHPKLENRTFMPYPVHQISEDIDYYLAGGKINCPRLQTALAEYNKTDSFSLFMAENAENINKICEKAGHEMNSWSLGSIKKIYDTVTCDKAHKLSQPEWLDDATIEMLKNISETERRLELSEKNVQKYQAGGGAFIHLLLENVRKVVNGTQRDTLFHLFYAHDTTLLGFLANLKYEKIHQNPQYTSCINMELHLRDDKYYVDLMYKNETDTMTMERLVPWGCPSNESCPWDEFLFAMETLEIVDPAKECQEGGDVVLELTFTSHSLIALSAAICILLSTILTVAYSCGKSTRESNKISYGGVQYEPVSFMQDT